MNQIDKHIAISIQASRDRVAAFERQLSLLQLAERTIPKNAEWRRIKREIARVQDIITSEREWIKYAQEEAGIDWAAMRRSMFRVIKGGKT